MTPYRRQLMVYSRVRSYVLANLKCSEYKPRLQTDKSQVKRDPQDQRRATWNREIFTKGSGYPMTGAQAYLTFPPSVTKLCDCSLRHLVVIFIVSSLLEAEITLDISYLSPVPILHWRYLRTGWLKWSRSRFWRKALSRSTLLLFILSLVIEAMRMNVSDCLNHWCCRIWYPLLVASQPS